MKVLLDWVANHTSRDNALIAAHPFWSRLDAALQAIKGVGPHTATVLITAGLLCVALVAAPWVVPEYWLAQLTFVLIYGIVGLGLMLSAAAVSATMTGSGDCTGLGSAGLSTTV